MLVFTQEQGLNHDPTPPALALLLPCLCVALGLATALSRLLWSKHRHSGWELLNDMHVTHDHNGEASPQTSWMTVAWRIAFELLKLLGGAVLLSITIVKLMDEVAEVRDPWTDVLDAGVLFVALCIVVTSFVAVIHPPASSAIRKQQIVVFGALLAVLGVENLVPFFYRSRPSVDLISDMGFVQTSVAGFLVFVLLFTPPRWEPLVPKAQPNPAQLASPISVLFFSFLEMRMWSWYRQTTKSEQTRDFLSFVPFLPDYLTSPWVLSTFRWTGDEAKPEEGKTDDGADARPPPSGTVWHFVWNFRLEFAKIVAFSTVWIVFIFISPLSMNLLLRYVQDDKQTALSPYVYVFGIFLSPILSSVAYQNAVYRLSQVGLRLRALLGHAVYAKVLRVKAGGGGTKGDGEGKGESTGGSEALGRVNNLVGTDIDVITTSLTTFLPLFGVLPKLVVSLVFLYVLLGWAAFVALASIVAFAPVSRAVSKKYGGVQEEIMKATDKRITLVGELVSAIRTIKMFSWESSSMARIYDARQTELERITKRAKVYAGLMFLSTGVPMVVTLATFGAYVFGMKRSLTASTAFTAMSLFGLLREAVVSTTFLLSAFLRARVSLGRISRFLADTEELDTSPRGLEGDEIELKDAKFRFSKYGSGGFELRIDELNIPRGATTIVAGDVGSGKSALLLALLGELHKRSGEVKFPANVATSYAAQSPWLQDDTVKANVLFGEAYDEERYHQTLHACALESDLDGFPDGDQTRVGEKGLSMSGGQKQRIALARAIYARTDVVLLDDVLSAVDSSTAAHIVDNCLNGPLLEGRTVILVTHFVKMCTRRIKACELVVELRDGEIKKKGPPQRDLTPNGSSMLRTSSSHSSFSQQGKEKEEELDEQPLEHHEESEGGTEISFKVYKRYFSSMGGWRFWTLYAFVNLVAHVFMLGQGYWVSQWVNAADRDDRPAFYFSIYTAIQLTSSVSLTAMYLALIAGAIRASRTLHQSLTTAIFGAPFRFFDVTPHGAILNRFSKDCEILDTEQVENLQPVLDYSVQVLFVAIIISVILPIFLLPAALIAVVFFFLGKLYIRNALAARKQVAEARSPLFSTLGDTSSGVVTIRAFRRTRYFARTYLRQTDRYNQMQLYENGLDRWLEERTDMVGALVSFIVGLLALQGGLSSGTTGFLVSTGLEFTSRILFVVRAINKNELSLNSVQRILAYSDTEQEEANSDRGEPPASWPSAGQIEFENYSARYSQDGPDVLHNLSFSVKAGEKVGIVGPSGCGKSSLSLALLRFIVPSGGTVTIDGRSIDSTNLDALRSRITLIPQDPVLFSGTLRSNLDPRDEFDDGELWAAIQRSGFAHEGAQGSTSAKGLSLDTVCQSGGANFSLGQRQMLSLARAIVARSRVLICDEATASLSNAEDETLQRVIRDEFRDRTLITIAHRLETIIDYDRVMVLEAGQIVEFDTPAKLLEKKDGKFYTLCQAAGEVIDFKRRAK